MNIEEQVCSLELASRLREIGIKQNSLFYWTIGGIVYRSEIPFFMDSNYSAFTVAELGIMLPELTSSIFEEGEWVACYLNNKNYKDIDTASDNEADCRAKILIYLIEGGFIKNDDSNS